MRGKSTDQDLFTLKHMKLWLHLVVMDINEQERRKKELCLFCSCLLLLVRLSAVSLSL